MSLLTVHIAAFLQLFFSGTAPAPTAVVAPAPASLVVAQAQVGAVSPRTATERVRADVAKLEGERAQLSAAKRELRKRYDVELLQLDKLKRTRPSFNRDRKIRQLKKSLSGKAAKLSKIERDLRAKNRPLARVQKRLLGAVRIELRAQPVGARAQKLRKLQRKLRKKLRPRARKIVLPDGSIDPTADPEDLEEQARLLERAETQLAAEETKLEKRAVYFAKVDRLSQQRVRAAELGRFDDNQPRRGVTGFSRGANSESAGAQAEEDGDGAAPPADPGRGDGADLSDFSSSGADGGLEASALVLADVVDNITLKDLRRASKSGSPKAKAKAAKNASSQVKSRLRKLRRQRAAIERRAKKLRDR